MSEPVLAVDVRNLGKVYYPAPRWLRLFMRSQIDAPVVALHDVSLQLRPGEMCVVAGPNGAGKTTLFRILTGLTTPTSGAASVLGRDVSRQSPDVRRNVGFMAGDDRSLFLRLSCRENLVFRGRLQGIPRSRLAPLVGETLELVGLGAVADRVGFALSQGMRARLQIACAMLHRPPVLILDEPTGPIDPLSAYQLTEMIRSVTKELRLAVLLSTHRVDEIEALSERVALMHRGRLVHWGDLDEVRVRWDRPSMEIAFERETDAVEASRALASVDGVDVVSVHPRSVTVVSGLGTGRVLASLNGQLSAITGIRQQNRPLRELLADMLGEPVPPVDPTGPDVER